MPDRTNIPHATSADIEYGHVCPLCASPKTKQALRCRRCYNDQRRRERRPQAPTATCPGCGGPMWSQSTTCRACWLAGDHPQPHDHPWRRKNNLLYVTA